MTDNQRVFELDDQAWSEFVALLDRPAERNPGLESLFSASSPFDVDPG